MSVFGRKNNADHQRYATRADFCRIFLEHMHPLYLLAFMLTANHARAEQCFVEGIEDATKENPVFKEWAHSWSRRVVIKNAIRVAFFAPERHDPPDEWRRSSRASSVSDSINAVARLSRLERFVFVMSVLERYSDRECSLMLDCTLQDVSESRMHALRTLMVTEPAFAEAVKGVPQRAVLSHQPRSEGRSGTCFSVFVSMEHSTRTTS